VEHIYDKLGVSTRAAAVVAAIGEGRLADVDRISPINAAGQ
jgi:hypothetical protein